MAKTTSRSPSILNTHLYSRIANLHRVSVPRIGSTSKPGGSVGKYRATRPI